MRVLREEVPLLCEGAGGVPWAFERLHSRLVERERERRPIGADLALEDLKPLLSDTKKRWPRLLADAVSRPAETAALLRRELALDEVRRAESIVSKHGPHASAVLAMLEAWRIDPSLDDVQRRLPALAAEAGVSLARRDDDDAIQELTGALRFQPRQAALWRRLADIRRLRGEVFDESVALRRALRHRPDEEVELRLARLLVGPDAKSVEPRLPQGHVDDDDTTTTNMPVARESALERRSARGRWLTAAMGVALVVAGFLAGAVSVMLLGR
jgi:hypothetical protein